MYPNLSLTSLLHVGLHGDGSELERAMKLAEVYTREKSFMAAGTHLSTPPTQHPLPKDICTFCVVCCDVLCCVVMCCVLCCVL